jgi:hypothetical protein
VAINSGTGSAAAQPAISGQGLDQPEGDDEREHRDAGGEVELVASDQRQRRALEADHRADEHVDCDQQRELRKVLAQPKLRMPSGHCSL